MQKLKAYKFLMSFKYLIDFNYQSFVINSIIKYQEEIEKNYLLRVLF